MGFEPVRDSIIDQLVGWGIGVITLPIWLPFFLYLMAKRPDCDCAEEMAEYDAKQKDREYE